MYERLRRLIVTFVAKKYVAWAVASAFLWFGKISGTDWILLTAAIFVIDLATKIRAPYSAGGTDAN